MYQNIACRHNLKKLKSVVKELNVKTVKTKFFGHELTVINFISSRATVPLIPLLAIIGKQV